MMDPVTITFAFSNGLCHTLMRICRLKLRPNFEPFFVILTLSVLVVLAIGAYLPLLTMAKMTQVLGHASMARMDGIYHYAIQGTWPKNNAASLSAGYQPNYRGDAGAYLREAVVVDGAIDFHFNKDLAGQVLTMRHAVSDPVAPVAIWVAGRQRADDGWIVIGEDRTTFDPKEINRRLW